MCRCSDARSVKRVGSLGDGEIDRQAGTGTASQEWKIEKLDEGTEMWEKRGAMEEWD